MAIIEYKHIRKNKFPHRITVHTDTEAEYEFFDDPTSAFHRDNMVLWLTENIGENWVDWTINYASKLVEDYLGNTTVSYGYYYHFLNGEDAALFRLTWG